MKYGNYKKTKGKPGTENVGISNGVRDLPSSRTPNDDDNDKYNVQIQIPRKITNIYINLCNLSTSYNRNTDIHTLHNQ